MLLQRDVAEPPPSVVVQLVRFEGGHVALFTTFVIFVRNVLVATEGVSICKIVVQLDGSAEKLECRLMLFLQTVAVADHAPGLRCKERLL